jgi:hypothetical protein
MPVVGKIHLYNAGGYNCHLGVKWIDPDGQSQHGPAYDPNGHVIMAAGSEDIDPGDVGVPNGSTIWAYIDVQAGWDNQGSAQDGLIFKLGDPHVANYESTGTTLNNGVKFQGVSPPE